MKNKIFVLFILSCLCQLTWADNCLDKSEIVIDEKSHFGACVLNHPLELRNKVLYCGDTKLDQWDYWSGSYKQVKTTQSTVLIQITNTCSRQIISSKQVVRKNVETLVYELSDTGSMYPDADRWSVNRRENKIDFIQVGDDCDLFTRGQTLRDSGQGLWSPEGAAVMLNHELKLCQENQNSR